MDYTLVKIKRLVLNDKIRWTTQARCQMTYDFLTEADVKEAILNSDIRFEKISRSKYKKSKREKVHIIKGFTFDGIFIYTKGVIRKDKNIETFYVMISAKKTED